MIRLLTVSTLYPNDQQPAHGIFVENRLRHLVASGQVDSKVVAPVAWAPSFYHGDLRKIAALDHRFGLTIHHPRFGVIPKVGMSIAPLLLYRALRSTVPAILANTGDIDLIDAHYFYPDGVAAMLLGKRLGKPVVITARGSDISQIADFTLPRRQIAWAARRASGLIAVCQALKQAMIGLGMEAQKIHVLSNGVDLLRFRPRPRDAARRRLGLTGPTLLSVGLLIPRKGHDLVIESLTRLPEFSLMIAGDGPERGALEALARARGLGDRVRFCGMVAPQDLPELYSAADALILASSREGWANVLLESMACGTPAIATDVWGNAEVVTEPAAGRLVARTPDGIAAGVRCLFKDKPAREDTRRYAERFSWDATTTGQISLFRAILESGRTARGRSAPRAA